MSAFNFQPLRGEFSSTEWRALDRALYRYVMAHGGSPLLSEMAAWCSYADSLGHTALSLDIAESVTGRRSFSAADHDALRAQTLVGDGSAPSAFVLDAERFYLWRNYASERTVATALRARMQFTQAASPSLATLIDALFADTDASATTQQQLAVQRATEHRLLVLTGGPGTGKTTTVLRMLLALIASRNKPLSIATAAPTGKAAQRLVQALRAGVEQMREHMPEYRRPLLDALPEFEALTLHRLLGHDPARGFRAGTRMPLATDIIVVDEASMIDLNLLRVLLQATPAESTLILLGDADQLTSVEAGSALMDIVAALGVLGAPQLVQLDHVFRADADLLPLNRAARDGDSARFMQSVAAAPDVISIRHMVDARMLAREIMRWAAVLATNIHNLVSDQNQRARPLNAAQVTEVAANALRTLGQQQLLCALREGEFGAAAVSRQIEQRLRVELDIDRDEVWFAGRSIMISQNDYPQRLFNGDVGICWPDADGHLRVWFDSVDAGGARSVRALSPNTLPEHQSACAITIHKSQGSEYGHVGIVLPPLADSRVLSRQLLYTALSRARRSVEIWGSVEVIEAALARPVRRESGLMAAIVNAADGTADSALVAALAKFSDDMFADGRQQPKMPD